MPEPVEVRPPVNFYSIEFASPAPSFWDTLARLLGSLSEAARRKGTRR